MNTPTTSEREPVKVIADILTHELNLNSGQITTNYQKYDIPNNGIFIVLGYLGNSDIIANQTYFDNVLDNEVQELLIQHRVTIDIMSMAPDNSARIRKEEIPMALRGFYSRNEQVKNRIGIYWNPTPIVDLTALEVTAMLNRYQTMAIVNALHVKTISSNSFNVFPISLVEPTVSTTIQTTEAF